MTTLSKTLFLFAIAFAFLGCVGEDPSGAAAGLAACPPHITEGAICDYAEELACVRGGDPTGTEPGDTDVDGTEPGGDVCRCEYLGDDSGLGVVVCGGGTTPPGPGICEEHVSTGEHCDPSGPSECQSSCDPDVTCRCVPASDAEDCGYLWLCEADMPPPGSCDDASLDECLMTGSGTCIGEDGSVCFCELSDDGEISIRCEGGGGPPGTEPGECTAEDYARCDSGEYVECFDPSGAFCFCAIDETGDGDDPGSTGGGGMICETTTPPGADYCTDEDRLACAEGRDVHCISEDGRECFCGDDAAGTMGGLTCY